MNNIMINERERAMRPRCLRRHRRSFLPSAAAKAAVLIITACHIHSIYAVDAASSNNAVKDDPLLAYSGGGGGGGGVRRRRRLVSHRNNSGQSNRLLPTDEYESAVVQQQTHRLGGSMLRNTKSNNQEYEQEEKMQLGNNQEYEEYAQKEEKIQMIYSQEESLNPGGNGFGQGINMLRDSKYHADVIKIDNPNNPGGYQPLYGHPTTQGERKEKDSGDDSDTVRSSKDKGGATEEEDDEPEVILTLGKEEGNEPDSDTGRSSKNKKVTTEEEENEPEVILTLGKEKETTDAGSNEKAKASDEKTKKTKATESSDDVDEEVKQNDDKKTTAEPAKKPKKEASDDSSGDESLPGLPTEDEEPVILVPPPDEIVHKTKVVSIQKSPNYSGDLNPAGTTMDITYSSSSSDDDDESSVVYTLMAMGLDPACLDSSIGNEDDPVVLPNGGGESDVQWPVPAPVEDEEESYCLCGYCVPDCNAFPIDSDDFANCHDSCMFVGHGFARPHALYLKVDPARSTITVPDQITVSFKGKKNQENPCQLTVDKDINTGTYFIAKPTDCADDGKPGLGTEIYIDYIPDVEGPDMAIHTSCSVELYPGMPLEDSPFIIEGNCLDEDEDSCSHVDDHICSRVPLPKPVSTASPTSTPTVSPTSTPTVAPSMKPTSAPTVGPTMQPTSPPTSSPTSTPTPPTLIIIRTPLNDPDQPDPLALFDPTSPLTTYTSAGCGPRGDDAFANLSVCTYGYVMVKQQIGSQEIGQVVSIIAREDGMLCQYFSFQVYECLPPAGGQDRRRLLLRDDNQEEPKTVVDNRELLSLFEPKSTLVGYLSNGCGPRGKNALADLTQCEYGHEKVEYVPWQNGNTVMEVAGCAYFSFEVYKCFPPLQVYTLNHPIAVIKKDDAKRSGSPMSCAVVVANGSCDDPKAHDFFVGKTAEDDFVVVDDSYDADKLDGKVMLVHDYGGTVIGCGAIEDGPEVLSEPAIDCICGCPITGNESVRPYSLYLKLDHPDKYLEKINVSFSFKVKKKNQECEAIVEVVNDDAGLFRIARPDGCDYDEPGFGDKLLIDYIGNSDPDVSIDVSCSEPLYVGMSEGPFIIEDYCSSEHDSSCR